MLLIVNLDLKECLLFYYLKVISMSLGLLKMEPPFKDNMEDQASVPGLLLVQDDF